MADTEQHIDERTAENLARDERRNQPAVDERADRDLSPSDRLARVREQSSSRRSRQGGSARSGDGERRLTPSERLARVREQSAARRARPIGEPIDQADVGDLDQTVVDHGYTIDDDPRQDHRTHGPRH